MINKITKKNRFTAIAMPVYKVLRGQTVPAYQQKQQFSKTGKKPVTGGSLAKTLKS